jgi:septum formation protein
MPARLPSCPSAAPSALIVLASTSVYRRNLLQRLFHRFEVVAPGVQEGQECGESVEAMTLRLALAKASAVAERFPEALVIGSDQAATLDGYHAIGKPGTLLRAREQLRAASGQIMRFSTALALVGLSRGVQDLEVVDTVVRFRKLADASIDRYLTREPALDCAGAAKCEALGIALTESIESRDPTALVGLPLIALTRMLRDAGVDVLAMDS